MRFPSAPRNPKVLVAAALLLLAGASAAIAQIATWQPVLIGSAGGLFPDGTIDSPFRLAVDPGNADIVYMGTGLIPSPGAPPPPADGLWRTSDGGSTWTMINEPSTGDAGLDFYELTADTSIIDIAVCKANPAVVAVAANPKGVFRSTDRGATWSWVSGGIVHTSADSDHCGAIQHPNQNFDTVGGRWAAATVAFDPLDCNILYAGAADINAIDIGAGTGDHPGVFKTTDGGATWTELNGGLRPRVDAIDCHSLTLKSKTVAPLSLKVTPSHDLVLVTTEQHVDASIFSKTATSQLKVWVNPGGAGSWTQVSTGLGGSQVTQTAALGDLAAVSVSAGFVTVAPNGNFYVASHLGIASKILLSGSDVTVNKSSGLWASLDLSAWFARDNGIPVVNDADSQNAQNTGPITVNPNNNKIWAVGTNLSDGARVNGSQVYVANTFGGNWINGDTAGLVGLANSPSGLYTESNVIFVEWDRAGRCLYATVLWDLAGGTATPDDGLYRACIF